MAGAGDGQALRVSGLSKAFLGTQALDDVSFAVAPGADPRAHRWQRLRQVDADQGSRRRAPGRSRAADRARGSEIDGGRTTRDGPAPPDCASCTRIPPTFPISPSPRTSPSARATTPRGRGRSSWRRLRRRAREVLDRFGIDAHRRRRCATAHRRPRPARRRPRAARRRSGRGLLFVLDEPTASLPAENAAACGSRSVAVPTRPHSAVREPPARGGHGTCRRRDGAARRAPGGDVAADEITEGRLVELIVGQPLASPSRGPRAANAEGRDDVGARGRAARRAARSAA